MSRPLHLIDELGRQQRRGLTLICNDTARPRFGVGWLIEAGLVSHVITSHIGTNPVTRCAMLDGRIQLEQLPQGTLAERVRAGGLGRVFTPTGVGTLAAQGRARLTVGRRVFLVESALRADMVLIAARRADCHGNLEYALTARDFNPLMAMAADLTSAEG